MATVPPPEDTPLPGASPEETKEEAKEETSAELPSGTTRQPEIYEVLEMATGHLNGIQAICTAEAILQLWNWESREELLKARNAVDYLLKKMEET